MKRMKGLGKTLFVGGLAAAGALGASSLGTKVQAFEVCCNCPFIELWVFCPDGNYYMNECWAAEAGQTGCEPVIPPPPGDPES